ncbi:MAG: BREX-6 system BrxE protein [Myxococcota bacterium]|nr:BREX-6 system BrxE protein [Myxococcota bacterium]
MARKTKGAATKDSALPEVQDEILDVDEPKVQLTDAAVLDEILSLQLLVGWAGEGKTDPPRLGWWRTSLSDEFGGEDLFKRLMPRTWKWAVLEAARVAARVADAEARSHAADGDQLISLFHFGFELDEQLDDRLAELKRSEQDPVEALPRLETIRQPWNAAAFVAGLSDLCAAATTSPSSLGRRLKGAMPKSHIEAARQLAAAMVPLGVHYPAPHWKVD